ncbi:unnamed protein product [Enterobius vermicularis]|uniref:Uncharacterized protein n=1 Tax=Enterobius vermicularis TaxID=51028 RepID=A0A0N4V2R3_ENTVE|nr:unnamed protein product [Enterobius vermicularis]
MTVTTKSTVFLTTTTTSTTTTAATTAVTTTTTITTPSTSTTAAPTTTEPLAESYHLLAVFVTALFIATILLIAKVIASHNSKRWSIFPAALLLNY